MEDVYTSWIFNKTCTTVLKTFLFSAVLAGRGIFFIMMMQVLFGDNWNFSSFMNHCNEMHMYEHAEVLIFKMRNFIYFKINMELL